MLKFIIVTMLFCATLYAGDFTVKSLEEAQILSKSTNQPILLIFGSPDCSFCSKLTTDIQNGSLTEYLDPYIICYIDLNNNDKYKNEYKISIIPDSRIIFNSKTISKATGYNKTSYSKWLNDNAK